VVWDLRGWEVVAGGGWSWVEGGVVVVLLTWDLCGVARRVATGVEKGWLVVVERREGEEEGEEEEEE
jgi:hypothetical protein